MPAQNIAPGSIWTKILKVSPEFGSYRVNLKSQKCKDQRVFWTKFTKIGKKFCI